MTTSNNGFCWRLCGTCGAGVTALVDGENDRTDDSEAEEENPGASACEAG